MMQRRLKADMPAPFNESSPNRPPSQQLLCGLLRR
jgi:hypothetical protein